MSQIIANVHSVATKDGITTLCTIGNDVYYWNYDTGAWVQNDKEHDK